MVENIEQYGGEFENSSEIVLYVLDGEGLISEDDYKQRNDEVKKMYLMKARDQYLASIVFLLGGT